MGFGANIFNKKGGAYFPPLTIHHSIHPKELNKKIKSIEMKRRQADRKAWR